MDPEEQALQREGYMAAITSQRIPQALKQGMHGRIALTYFEWAGMHHQQIIVPWRLIDGPESADGFAADIGRAATRAPRAPRFRARCCLPPPLFEGSGYRGVRRVIDVSGDGVNNNGPPVTLTRDEVLATGHHHQRPADPVEAAELRARSISTTRHLLRGLRDRRAGAFVIPIRERDAVQGGDPHQARAGDRRPHAGTADRAGGGRRRASPAPSASVWQERWAIGRGYFGLISSVRPLGGTEYFAKVWSSARGGERFLQRKT